PQRQVLPLLGFDEVDCLMAMVQTIELAYAGTDVLRIVAKRVARTAATRYGERVTGWVAVRKRLFPIVEVIHWPIVLHGTTRQGSAERREVPNCAKSQNARSPELRKVPKCAKSQNAADGGRCNLCSRRSELKIG